MYILYQYSDYKHGRYGLTDSEKRDIHQRMYDIRWYIGLLSILIIKPIDFFQCVHEIASDIRLIPLLLHSK